MTRETVEWLIWLVGQQTVQVGATDAREQAEMAWRALDMLRRLATEADIRAAEVAAAAQVKMLDGVD